MLECGYRVPSVTLKNRRNTMAARLHWTGVDAWLEERAGSIAHGVNQSLTGIAASADACLVPCAIACLQPTGDGPRNEAADRAVRTVGIRMKPITL
jgi:hypothetical protein